MMQHYSTGVPAVRGPRDLPDFRTWLLKQWTNGPFAEVYRERATYWDFDAPHGARRDRGGPDAEKQISWERRMLNGASLWWVSAEMCELLCATANGIHDDLLGTEVDPLGPAGLVVFENPIIGTDADRPGKHVQVDAVVWGGSFLAPIPERDGSDGRPPLNNGGIACASVSSYRRLSADQGIGPDEMSMATAAGVLNPNEWEVRVTDDDEWEPAPEIARRYRDGELDLAAETQVGARGVLHGDMWVPIGRSDWPLVDEIGSPPWPMDDQARESFVEDRKLLVAFFTLIQQEGITSRTVHRDRAAMRRAHRAGVSKDSDSAVTIITLRRPRHVDADGSPTREDVTPRDWKHRWIVDGHWRMQPYGPRRSLRRLIFIAPYLKGPEDKPLKTKTKVRAWVR